jgi:hypothetical protein
MEQPPEYKMADQHTFVLKLQKALYGLKQGGQKWYNTLCRTLTKLALKRAEANFGVFHVHIGGDIILLTIYVDDCVLTGSNVGLLTEFKQKVGTIYKLTDLGPISWLLGIKVTRDRPTKTLHLSQTVRGTPLDLSSFIFLSLSLFLFLILLFLVHLLVASIVTVTIMVTVT